MAWIVQIEKNVINKPKTQITPTKLLEISTRTQAEKRKLDGEETNNNSNIYIKAINYDFT